MANEIKGAVNITTGEEVENLDARYQMISDRLETKTDDYTVTVNDVEKTFVIQAGREIRIIVSPEKVSDAESAQLAAEIAKAVQEQLDYPGQVKVTVIRETRAVDYAR